MNDETTPVDETAAAEVTPEAVDEVIADVEAEQAQAEAEAKEAEQDASTAGEAPVE